MAGSLVVDVVVFTLMLVGVVIERPLDVADWEGVSPLLGKSSGLVCDEEDAVVVVDVTADDADENEDTDADEPLV